MLANISDEHLIPIIRANPAQYADFVYRLVERYDGDEDLGCIFNNGGDCYKEGDGQYPAPSVIAAFQANPSKYWQVGKVGKDTSFALVQRITYNAIKLADSSATLAIIQTRSGDCARKGSRRLRQRLVEKMQRLVHSKSSGE